MCAVWALTVDLLIGFPSTVSLLYTVIQVEDTNQNGHLSVLELTQRHPDVAAEFCAARLSEQRRWHRQPGGGGDELAALRARLDSLSGPANKKARQKLNQKIRTLEAQQS